MWSAIFVLHLLQGIPEPLPLNPIARWEWVFPVVEAIHICGFSLLVGTILILDLRLLGWCLPRQPISSIARGLAPWIWIGIAIQLTTGPYLFSSDPHEYVLFLVLALIFHFTVIRKATEPSRDAASPPWRKPAACVSLGLWLCVLLSGLWIGNL
jgi:hypothetical protein